LNNGFEERGDGRCLLHVSDTRFKLVHVGKIDQFEIARRQLWLFALREFPSLPRDETPKRAGPKSCVDESKLFELAVLAHRLGCRSDQIDRIRANACWKPSPKHSVCVQDPDIDTKPYKHGKPHPNDLKRHKSSLFLSNFHKPFDQESLESSFFFIQRSLYFDIYPDEPRGIDELLQRAAEVGECDLIDDEYRPKMQGASEQLIRQEDELRATLSELQKRYDQLFLQEMQCQSSIGDKTKELEQLNNNIEAMKLQEQELIDQKQKFEKDVRTAKRIFKDKDKKYKELCRKLTEAEQDLSNINSMRETASDNLQSIQDQAEGTSRVVDDLETRKKNLESEAQVLSSQAKPLVS
jgi:hypothetical protein